MKFGLFRLRGYEMGLRGVKLEHLFDMNFNFSYIDATISCENGSKTEIRERKSP